MTAPVLKVGDVAVHVDRILGGRPRQIRRATIVRETPTLWIDDIGGRWRKSDGRSVPDYMGCRFLMSAAEFEAAKGAPS